MIQNEYKVSITLPRLEKELDVKKDINIKNIAYNIDNETLNLIVQSKASLTDNNCCYNEGEKHFSIDLCLIQKDNMISLFRVDDIIKDKNNNKTYRCICADHETAVFAPFFKIENKHYSTNFKGLIAYSNSPEFKEEAYNNIEIIGHFN